jgi:hypothetical protein
MYLHNKYTKWYYNIVDLAKSRSKLSDSYYEKHHIIPKSLGGTNDVKNLVLLTAREHFICHLLLTKMVTGDARRKMAYACARMIHGNKYQQRYKINSSRYQQLRIRLNKYLVGRTFSNETRKKMSLAKLGIPKPQAIADGLRVARKGKTNSQEHRDKCSRALRGRTFTNETRLKMKLNHYDATGKNNPRARTWEVISPYGEKTLVEGQMTQFCQRYGLPASVMRSIGRTGVTPKTGRCVGWQVKIIYDES